MKKRLLSLAITLTLVIGSIVWVNAGDGTTWIDDFADAHYQLYGLYGATEKAAVDYSASQTASGIVAEDGYIYFGTTFWVAGLEGETVNMSLYVSPYTRSDEDVITNFEHNNEYSGTWNDITVSKAYIKENVTIANNIRNQYRVKVSDDCVLALGGMAKDVHSSNYLPLDERYLVVEGNTWTLVSVAPVIETTTEEVTTEEPTTEEVTTAEETTTEEVTTSEETTEEVSTEEITTSEEITSEESTTEEITTAEETTTEEVTTEAPTEVVSTTEAPTEAGSTTEEITTTDEGTTAGESTTPQDTTTEELTSAIITTDITTVPSTDPSTETTTLVPGTSAEPTVAPATTAPIKLGRVKIKKIWAKKKSAKKLRIKVKKVAGAKGYQVAVYKTKKKAKKNKKAFLKKYVKKNKAKFVIKSAKLKKLKKAFYVKVRAYQRIVDTVTYGKWSKIKRVKVKK